MSPDRPVVDPATPGHLTLYIRSIALLARTVLRCLTRVRVDGPLDRIPRTGPLIIASNHLSNADGPLVGGWLTPALGRRMHWLGKREFAAHPILGPIARAGSVHAVDRDTADLEAFRLAQRILEAGNVLLVFPEGTRSPTGGLQRPRDGVAMLALRTGAPILPVGLRGTDRLWPRGGRPRPGGRIGLRVGEAFLLREALGQTTRDRRAEKAAATDLIMRRIAALLPERHRGVYADAPGEPPTHPTGDDERTAG